MNYDVDELNELAQTNEEEYLRTIKKLIKESDNHRTIYKLANHLFYNLYFKEAKKNLRTILNTTSGALAHYKLGEIEKFAGNFEKARMHFEKSLKQNPNPTAFNNLANMEFFLGNNEAAKENYYRSLNHQKNSHALNYLGKVYLSDKDYQTAEEIFNIHLNKYNKTVGNMNLVSLYIKKQDYEKAAYYFEQIKSEISKEDLPEVYANNISSYLEYMLKNTIQNPTSYFEQQLLEYSIDTLITHLKKHTDLEITQAASIFNEGIDIQEVITYATEQIKDKKIYLSNSGDTYIVKFDKEIGENFGQPTKYTKVITIANTKKILTIFPIIASDKPQTQKFFEKQVRKRIKE